MNKYINELRKAESIFHQAGELALKMQEVVKCSKKGNSGFLAVDIVTQADLDVQEFILNHLAITCLTDCKLLAEENTKSVAKFNPNGKLTLTVDPINGTLLYSQGKKTFDILISLHDNKKVLYTYDLFPGLKWTNIIFSSKHIEIGKRPKFKNANKFKNIILLKYHQEKLKIDKKMQKRLINKGYIFKKSSFRKDEDIKSITSITTNGKILSGLVAGIYIQSPVVYDGLVPLHLAQAKKYQLFTSEDLDLSKYKKDKVATKHPGSYLMLMR